jgi:uncharacterized membrane protein
VIPSGDVIAVTQDRRTLLALALATATALGLVLVRMAVVGSRGYGFLGWNLFLAWVPLGLSHLAWRWRTAHAGLFALALVGWLVFFPNAPYIVTDLMHLRTTRGAPLWLDGLVVGSAAVAGLFVGLVSLRLVHDAWVTRWGRPRLAWVAAALACYLAALGVYLGRFMRWNTWDLVRKPDEILADAWATLAEPRMLGFVALFGSALVVAYLIYRLVAGTRTS